MPEQLPLESEQSSRPLFIHDPNDPAWQMTPEIEKFIQKSVEATKARRIAMDRAKLKPKELEIGYYGDSLYTSPDAILPLISREEKLMRIIEICSDERDFPEMVQEESFDLDVFCGSSLDAIRQVNAAGKRVFARYGIVANPSEDDVFFLQLHINSRTAEIIDFQAVNALYEKGLSCGRDSGIPIPMETVPYIETVFFPHSFSDHQTGLIVLSDIDIGDKGENIDDLKLITVYAHEFAHKYGLPHESLTDDPEEDGIYRRSGLYFSTYFGEGGGFSAMKWLNEASVIHMAAEIKYEAGKSDSPYPASEDWSDYEYSKEDQRLFSKTERRFKLLTDDIVYYLAQEENKDDLDVLRFFSQSGGLYLEEINHDTIRKLLVMSGFNRNAYAGTIVLLYTIFSKIEIKKHGETIWDKMCDDIGLFGADGLSEYLENFQELYANRLSYDNEDEEDF